MPLHILIIPSFYPSSFSPIEGIFIRDQARALAQAGFQVGVTYPEARSVTAVGGGDLCRSGIWESVEEGVATLRWRGWRPPKLHRLGARQWQANCQMLISEYFTRYGRPDVLHAHNTQLAGIAARRASQALGVPYVITEHSSAYGRDLLPGWLRTPTLDALRHAGSVLAVGSSLREAVNEYAGIGEIDVVPNVVDVDFFTRQQDRRNTSPFTVAVVARLVENKRVGLLLDAFALAFPGMDDVRLEVAGDGPLRRELRSQAKTLGIDDRVRFHGRLERSEVRELLWRSNVLAIASDIETFGVVAIEAMAAGIPVISTRCGGPEDFVRAGYGLIVERGDVGAMARGLVDFHSNAAPWLDRQTEIRRYASDRFGPIALVERLRNVFEAAVQDS